MLYLKFNMKLKLRCDAIRVKTAGKRDGQRQVAASEERWGKGRLG